MLLFFLQVGYVSVYSLLNFSIREKCSVLFCTLEEGERKGSIRYRQTF